MDGFSSVLSGVACLVLVGSGGLAGCGGKVAFEEERADSGAGGCLNAPCAQDRCPPTLPTTGEACDVYDLDCAYSVGCGEALAHCGGFDWQVSLPICQGPICLDVVTQAECIQTGGCEWLVPGCGEPALPMAGCQSSSECTEDDCPFDWSCELVVVDPCTVDPCGMCYAERLACVPPIDG